MISHLNQSITDVIFIIMHDQQGIYFLVFLKRNWTLSGLTYKNT